MLGEPLSRLRRNGRPHAHRGIWSRPRVGSAACFSTAGAFSAASLVVLLLLLIAACITSSYFSTVAAQRRQWIGQAGLAVLAL